MRKILFIFILFIANAAFGIEEKTIVRVGISDNAFSTYEHAYAEFILPGASSVIDMAQDKINLDKSGVVEVRMADGLFFININGNPEIKGTSGPVVITSTDKIGIKNIKRKGTPAYYGGMIELKSAGANKFNIINVLDMQTYLKGVVPNEMPVSFGFEALKAQSVAARNYANRPNGYYKNYDVCDSTACQVYYGKNSQTPISDLAVDETEGIYALYDNEIILALYSSTPGGVTENYLDTFGNFIEDKPYLKSVADNDELKTKNEEKYFKEKIPSFDMNSPKYRWKTTFDRFELEEILSKTLLEQSKAGNVFPKFTSGDTFFGLEDIKILKRGESKKALSVEIKSVSGDYTVEKELPIRRVFKKDGKILFSANFIVEKSKDETGESKEPVFKSEGKKVYRTRLGKKLPGSFVFYGAGFGHGVGMSQYGAGFLSSYGVTYDNILKHYYTGIKLGTIPKTVSHNNLNLDYTQKFYFKKSKNKGGFENPGKSPLKAEIKTLLEQNKAERCFLTIENTDNISKIEFYINDTYFSPEMKNFKKKILKTDITEYLKNGENKLVFKPLKESDKKKSFKFYITLEEK